MNMKLRLGPLPGTDVSRLSIAISADLKAELDAYVEAYCEAWGKRTDLSALIPHILQSFIERDRAFQRIRRIRKP